MNETNTWLSHLEEAVPETGYGNKLSMYLISLEAWRRGITINFFNKDNPDNKILVRYSLKYQGREHHFESSRGDKLSKEAFEICNNKDLTKQFMKEAGVKVPEGRLFKREATEEDILSYADMIGYPVVLKPNDENAGKGVFPNIPDTESLKETLMHLREELNYTELLLEKFIPGIEYRVFLINGKVLAAVNRNPANIIGNGKDTVEDLIKQKNKSKKLNPLLSTKVIKVDKEVMTNLEQYGYDLQSIVPNGKRVYLRNKSNVSTGGDSVDVTELLTEEQISMASKAALAIPGLDICGLDMIVDEDTGNGTIIEINTKPMIGLHVFPMEGKARDVVEHIVDYYFPETIGKQKSNLYFDFNKILAPLNNITTKQIELLPPAEISTNLAKRLTLNGKGFNVTFKGKVRRIALQYQVHGYVKKSGLNAVEIIIAHPESHILSKFQNDIIDLVGDAMTDFVEEDWYKPVKIGFEIRKKDWSELSSKLADEKNNKRKLLKQVKEAKEQSKKYKHITEDQKTEIQILQEKVEQLLEKQGRLISNQKDLQKELQEEKERRTMMEDKYEGVLQSKSWTITKPLRDMKRIFK